MKKRNLLFSIMAFSLICIQPVYAEGSAVVFNVAEATPEGKAAAFTEKYSAKLDELIELIKGDDYSVVTDKMQEFSYTEMLTNLPYDGFCYPTVNGEGLKLFQDYLYCGSLANGVAEGQGKMYRVFPTIKPRFGMYVGNWSNDAPNGSGEEWSNCIGDNGFKFRMHYIGNFIDWYQDGNMVAEVYFDGGRRTYRYHVTDKIADVIDTKVAKNDPRTPIIAYAEEKPSSYFSHYNTPQTVLWHPLDDGNLKNRRGLWYVK